MVLREYTIISSQRRFDSTQLHNLIEGLDLCFGIGIGNLCIVGLVALIVRFISMVKLSSHISLHRKESDILWFSQSKG